MGSNKFAVLNVESDSITLAVQDAKRENVLLFKHSAAYDGYQSGEFLNVTGLFRAVETVVNECINTLSYIPAYVMIGVPGEFTAVVCKNVQTTFNSRRPVEYYDMDKLLYEGDSFKNNAVYEKINASPVYYMCDDRKKSINPVGIITNGLSACISYVLCERSFIRLFDGFAEKFNLKFEYTSSDLAEILYVVPKDARDKGGALLLDSGYISSTLSYARGDGILYSASFSLGLGHIAGDLTSYLGVPYNKALELCKKINLNIKSDGDAQYTVNRHSYKIEEVNEVARHKITSIAKTINKAIRNGNQEIKPQVPVLLTGGGIASVAGAKEILAEVTGRDVVLIHPVKLQLDKPAQSSLAGLLEVALKHHKILKPRSKLKTFLQGLRRKIK